MTTPLSTSEPSTADRTRDAGSPGVAPSDDPQPAIDRPAIDLPAWRSPGAWALFLAVIVLGTAADLISKWAAFRWVAGVPVQVPLERVLEIKRTLGPGQVQRVIHEQLNGPVPEIVVIPGLLNWTLVLNPGAVFGTGAGGRSFFIAFTLGALLLAGLMFALWTRARERVAHVAIALIVAGGLGNMYDRLLFACVRDFIHPLPGVKFPGGWDPFGNGGEVWPYVSNVADKLLIVGVALTAGFLIWKDIADRRAARAEQRLIDDNASKN
jgi:lipoprotein signal peptidase